MYATFATCWYALNSKFPVDTYLRWMKYMLEDVQNYYLVLFTDAEGEKTLRDHFAPYYFLNPHIKIIVLERSVTAIMQSFMKLYKNNNWSEEYMHQILKAMLVPNVDPIMRSIIGINMAKKENAQRPPAQQTFLFIQYDDLIAKPAETIERIYAFCGWEPFTHQFDKIVNAHPENDAYYNLKGFHTIRPTLRKEKNTAILPPDILAKCQKIDILMGGVPPTPPLLG